LLSGGKAFAILFAAQTLKHKIVLDWRQLDEQAALGLRERLWSLIFSGDVTAGTAVLIQLKLALAALIVQAPTTLWPDPVADLFSFASQTPGQLSQVLDVLALIPEQLGNKSIQFGSTEAYHQKCTSLLENHIDNLIQLVLKVLQESRLQDRLQVSKDLLACLLAWIQFGGNGSKIIESPEFLNGLFVLLQGSCCKLVVDTTEDEDNVEDEEEHLQIVETCCELLVELIVRMSGRIEDWDDNQPENSEGEGNGNKFGDEWFKQLNEQWIPTLSSQLCQLPVMRGLQLRKEALLRPLVTLLCESVELFLPHLMERTEEFKLLSETILLIAEFSSSIPSNILELTFNFWNALPAELASFGNSSQDIETRQEPFVYLFARLFSALLRGPLVFRVGGSAEDTDRFRDFRHVVGDCLKDCLRVLGSTEALLLVRNQLSSVGVSLVEREAALFALRTISSSVDPRESEAMPTIVPSLLEILNELLQDSNSRLQPLKMVSAVVLNVGCYAEWLRYHSEFLGVFLQILSASLDYALTAPGDATSPLELPASVIGSSLQSLKYMCESCAGLLGPQYTALEGLFLRVYPTPSLSRRDRLDLTEAVALVLSRRASWSDADFLCAVERILQLVWQGGVACLEDYAVLLENTMLPELPRTPLIFSHVFLVSFADRLSPAFVAPQSSASDEEAFCEAWLRVLQAAINNGTSGAVGDFVNGPLLAWLNGQVCVFDGLSAAKQAALFNLTSLLVSGQLIASAPETLLLAILGQSSRPSPHHQSESWIAERCNLLRVAIIYVFTRTATLTALLSQSGACEMLQTLLAPTRLLSALEIVSLCGFLSALFGALLVESESLNEAEQIRVCVEFLEGVLLRVCEAAILEWPLSHINDLAMILGKTARDASLLKPLTWSLFSSSSSSNTRNLNLLHLFSADSSTPTELLALSQDFSQALTAACKSYRPKTLRLFLKGVAETCRRRRYM
jgi:hypothetical protein